MSQPERTPLETAALAVYYHAAELLQDGKSHSEVEAQLVRQGISKGQARRILARLEQSRTNLLRRRGWRNITFGLIFSGLLLFPLLGIGTSALSGMQQVFTLILLGGGLLILGRGWLQLTKNSTESF